MDNEQLQLKKFKLPTKTSGCSCTQNEYSEDLIRPKVVPIELEGLITFKQYEYLIKTCKSVIRKKLIADKLYYITFILAILGFFLYFPYLHANRNLLLLGITIGIISVIIIGSVLSKLRIMRIKQQLDKKIDLLNLEFKDNNIIIEKEIKKVQVSSIRSKEYLLINIYYNNDRTKSTIIQTGNIDIIKNNVKLEKQKEKVEIVIIDNLKEKASDTTINKNEYIQIGLNEEEEEEEQFNENNINMNTLESKFKTSIVYCDDKLPLIV